MSVVDELSQLVRDTDAAVGRAVVAIGRHGRGTGFVIATNRVVTNAHNLRDRTTEVRFDDDRTVQGTVVGSDVDGDLVVLEVDTGEVAPLEWAENAVATGDVVVAVTAGRQQRRAGWGQVTRAEAGFRGPRGRRIHGAIEHVAPCAAGSSGAPVLDRSARVVAINTHRLEHGFYLARAADAALRDAVAGMSEGRTYQRQTLGVALAPSAVAARLRQSVGLPERDGLLVRSVVEGSPAEAAGIQQGDLLVRAADRDLRSADDLFDVLGSVAPGGELAISVVRGVEELALTATFAAPSSDEE